MSVIIQRSAPKTSAEPSFSDNLSPLLQRIYRARGLTSDRQIDYRLQHLAQPGLLKGCPAATDLLTSALRERQRVLIVGDFDADGATSCALSVLALRAMGLQQVDFLVPNRFDFGYGLTPEIVEEARKYQPDLIITVDNGITSIDGVARAKSLGINVLITDHHLASDQLPAADAIVNPNQPHCEFPSKHLAGVGVIFYLLSSLRTALRATGWFQQRQITEPNLAEFLDLVALGTVADVVPLDHNNRILVHQGIRRIRAGKARPGILALLQVAGKNHQKLNSADLGFIVGPRLNAAGRMDDISLGIQCLLTDDPLYARELAGELDTLNRERRAVETAMHQEAEGFLDALSLNEKELPWGLCLYDQHWHQGVVGLLASRIKDKYHRPVIAFAQADEATLKGSARSIQGLNIRDALNLVATQHPDVLQKFGGHAMAAGLSLDRRHYATFVELFDQVIRAQLNAEDLQQTIETDGELAPEELTIDIAHSLQSAGPWGQHFPEPLFHGQFVVIDQRIVGERHLKLRLGLDSQAPVIVDAIAFNIDINIWPDADCQKVLLVYQLAVNEYRGLETVQMIVKHIEPAQ